MDQFLVFDNGTRRVEYNRDTHLAIVYTDRPNFSGQTPDRYMSKTKTRPGKWYLSQERLEVNGPRRERFDASNPGAKADFYRWVESTWGFY